MGDSHKPQKPTRKLIALVPGNASPQQVAKAVEQIKQRFREEQGKQPRSPEQT
jgi:hypothetical protein